MLAVERKVYIAMEVRVGNLFGTPRLVAKKNPEKAAGPVPDEIDPTGGDLSNGKRSPRKEYNTRVE